MSLLRSLLPVYLALVPSSRGQVEETCAAQGDGFQCVEEQEAAKMNCTTLVPSSDTWQSIRPQSSTQRPPSHCSGALGFMMDATCDNIIKLYADENLLATSDDWSKTTAVNIPANTEVIEIHCENLGGPAGILASSNNGLKTDGAWTCSSDIGVTWNPAYEIGINGMSPWGVRPDISTGVDGAKWIWTGNDTWRSGNHNNVICKIILGSGQHFCCRPPEPAKCQDIQCSTRKGFKEWTCQPKYVAASWPKVCQYNQRLCSLLGGSQCSCCAPKYVECEDVGCSAKGDGYECKNETEAKEWPVPCRQSERLCKKNCFIHNTGSQKYSPHNLDPISPSPEDCQLRCQADPSCQWFNYVPATSSPRGCWLLRYPKTGETSTVSTIGWVTGPKYCSKCYCCPNIIETNLCEDTGCKEQFDGQGICKDVEKANWDDLDADFDLAAGSRDNNTCKKNGTDQKKDCCRCFKKKNCLDVGCKEEFGSNGICVDKSNADVAHLKKTIDFSAGEKEGKCRNTFKEDCCSCFKKITAKCRNKKCESLKGKCVIEGEIPPLNHSKSFSCNKTLNCNCYILKCQDDRCEGQCIHTLAQRPPTGFIPNGYECNGNKLCLCYVEIGCQDDKCTKELKGICIGPDHIKPTGYVNGNYNCNGKMECNCYVPDYTFKPNWK